MYDQIAVRLAGCGFFRKWVKASSLFHDWRDMEQYLHLTKGEVFPICIDETIPKVIDHLGVDGVLDGRMVFRDVGLDTDYGRFKVAKVRFSDQVERVLGRNYFLEHKSRSLEDVYLPLSFANAVWVERRGGWEAIHKKQREEDKLYFAYEKYDHIHP